jgi:sulfate transport system ATP-binding protein
MAADAKGYRETNCAATLSRQLFDSTRVWDHPASPIVSGFLGDVNIFHGRAYEGEMQIGEDHLDVRLDSPEHSTAQDAKAYA